MAEATEQVLLRIYLRSADRPPRTPTSERIVKAARAEKLAGATVLQGILGGGHHGLARDKPWALIEHVPLIVEIADEAEKIVRFVEGALAELMFAGMATMERASVGMYRHRKHEKKTELRISTFVEPLSTLPAIQPRDNMNINEDGVLLRVFIGESDRWEHRPLYEAIVQKVRELGLSGATVLRGIEGFGANSVVHKAKLLELSSDLPIVVEIVDTKEKVQAILPVLETMVSEGMITMEYVRILAYRERGARGEGQGAS